MARIICRKCEADVTDAYHSEPLPRQFRCARCEGRDFIEQPEPPTVAYELTINDARFLKSCKISTKDAA